MATEAGNLDIQRAINDALTERSSIMAKQATQLEGQVRLAKELCEAIKCADASSGVRGLRGMTDAVNTAGAAVGRLKTGVGDMASTVSRMGSKWSATNERMIATTKRADTESRRFTSTSKVLWSGMLKAAEVFRVKMTALVDVATSVTRGFFALAEAVLSIPFKVFEVISNKAAELMTAGVVLLEAYEDVRETFGDLARGEAKDVVDSFTQIRSAAGGLAGTSLTFYRAFGYGPEGMAAALRALNETAAAMGPLFSKVSDEFTATADSVFVLQKGLGTTNEEMKMVAAMAVSRGRTIVDELSEMGSMAVGLGKSFGISSKLIGRDLSYMTSNMGKFGSMTKAQMGTAAVYTHKLGLEIKDLEGLLGAFDDFEIAAQNASKLAQAFGLNVDALRMMKEQDPAKRLEMLRSSFLATGRSIESMTRQEKQLLAQTAGLDENMVELALSGKNVGLSYDQIKQKADKSQKSHMSQTEVLESLSKNIKRFVETIQHSGSFLEQFFNGMGRGIFYSAPMMKLLHAIGRGLKDVYWLGRDVGRIFVESFPGVKDMIEAVADAFGKFHGGLRGFATYFKDFFLSLQKDPLKATQVFMSKMKRLLFDAFDPRSSSGSKFIMGAKSFVKSLAGVFGGLVKFAGDALASAMRSLASTLRDPQWLKDMLSGQGAGWASAFSPIVQAVKDVGPLLVDALVDLAGAALGALVDQFASMSGDRKLGLAMGAIGYFAGDTFAGKLAIAAGVALSASRVARDIGPKIQAGFAGPAVNRAASVAGGEIAATVVGSLSGGLLSDDALASIGLGVAGVVDSMMTSLRRFSPQLAAGVTKILEGTFGGVSALGDVVGGLFEMDFARAMSGLRRFGTSLVELSSGILDFLFSLVPKAVDGLSALLRAGLRNGIPMVVSGLKGLGVAIGKAVVGAWKFLTDARYRASVVGSGSSMSMMFIDGVVSFLKSAASSVAGVVLDIVLGVVEGATGTTINVTGKRMAEMLVSSMLAQAKASIASVYQVGLSIVTGFVSSFTGLKDSMVGAFGDAWKGVKELFGIRSPSAVAAEAGEAITAGFAGGLSGTEGVMSTAGKSAVKGFLDSVSGIDATAASEAAKTLGDVSAAVASLSSAVASLSSLSAQSVGRAFSGLAGSAGALASVRWSDISTSLITFVSRVNAPLLESVRQPLSTLSDIMSMAVSASSSALSLRTIDGEALTRRVGSTMDALASSLGTIPVARLGAVAASLSAYRSLGLGGSVVAVVDDIKAANAALTELGHVRVNATIDKLGDALKLKSEVLKISERPLQMNVELNLTMKAEDIAKEIFNVAAKLAKKTPFEPDTEGIRSFA